MAKKDNNKKPRACWLRQPLHKAQTAVRSGRPNPGIKPKSLWRASLYQRLRPVVSLLYEAEIHIVLREHP